MAPALFVAQGLTQEAEDYKTKAAHVELAEKMKKRDPATAPAVGDRVPYVIIKVGAGIALEWGFREWPNGVSGTVCCRAGVQWQEG